nr:pseudouridine synthase [Motiliproteus sediminis]
MLGNLPQGSRQLARHWLASGRIAVDGVRIADGCYPVTPFSRVTLDDQPIQTRQPRYFMLHKPGGYLSATSDPDHPTVMELLDDADSGQLHIAGRLDRASTGLLLLTDDGRWSRRLTEPERRVAKVYRVDTEDPIHPDTARRFAEGIYFDYEGITTRPVELQQLGPRQVRLTLFEGRYHQIKRMFGRFRNRVLSLHREQIGSLALDPDLAPGEYRPLTPAEVSALGD